MGAGEIGVQSVVEWRRSMLEEAGYPQEEAFLLAKRLDIDLHVARDLIIGGCPLKTAIKILT
jgi:hypothetical protein